MMYDNFFGAEPGWLHSLTDFLALVAGWGVVVICSVAWFIMLIRDKIVGQPRTIVQQAVMELFTAFNLLIYRNIFLYYFLHRDDFPQPWRLLFWLLVLTLVWRFWYFALWQVWVRPAVVGTWEILIKPRLPHLRG